MGDALKLCRRLGCLFPNMPEALSLAVVATGRAHRKDLEEAAWPCLISRARGDGERRYGDLRSEGHPREDRCAGAALKDAGGLWGGNSATQPRTALCTLLGLPGGQAMGHAWNPGGLQGRRLDLKPDVRCCSAGIFLWGSERLFHLSLFSRLYQKPLFFLVLLFLINLF